MQPLISVIIPIYNMEQYLARCLDSVLNNTYRNLEVICIDDGSKDSSLEILREYEKRDSRIVVIAKENGGVSSARNAGLDRASGRYVAFIDPDDFVHPQYFSRLLDAILQSGAEVSCCGFKTVEEGEELPAAPEQLGDVSESARVLSALQLFKNHELRSYCCGKLFDADILSDIRFRNMNYSEDSVFVAEVWEYSRNTKAAVIPDALYYYYQREASLVKEAKMPDRLKAAEIYAMKAQQSAENDVIFLDQAIKRCLSTRYYASHILLDKSISRKCAELLRDCRKQLHKTDIYSKKEKLRYSAFIRFPGLYWLYRSITEPYMWKWEKVERRKRREAGCSDKEGRACT